MTIKTKKGMASLYLVAFTTLLLGILTMSFVRVMLTESKEAANSDLSQSAYDSALAGIEDAKTAIIMYNTCREKKDDINANFSFKYRCDEIINLMEKSFDAFENRGDGSCNTVPNILGIPLVDNGSAVAVGATDNEGNSKLNQYYTCVTLTNEADEYLTILGESTPSRTIPVRLEEGEFSKVLAFEIQWYSRSKDDNISPRGYMSDLVLTGLSTEGFKPFGRKNQANGDLPILAAEIIQTDLNFQMYDLDLNNDSNSGTDHATVVLYPSRSSSSAVFGGSRNGFITNAIKRETVLAVSNKNSAERKQSPQEVYCAANRDKDYDWYEDDYRCRATIQIPRTYRGNDGYGRDRAEHTFMVRVSLPYGVPDDTDVSIRACTAINANGVCTKYAHWINQFVIDSTGRASTLYRRLTARVDTINTIFIYPDYAAEARGNNATVEKRLYATKNCWATDDAGGSTICANNGDAKIYPEEEPVTTN